MLSSRMSWHWTAYTLSVFASYERFTVLTRLEKEAPQENNSLGDALCNESPRENKRLGGAVCEGDTPRINGQGRPKVDRRVARGP